MDRWKSFSDDDLRERIEFVSSSVVLTMSDAEDLADLTEKITGDIIRREIEDPHTLRGLVRYMLGTDIPDDDDRAAHVQTWLDLIDRRIDTEIEDRKAVRTELMRRENGGESAGGGRWSEYDTVDLKLRITNEKLTTRFSATDKIELGKLIERIKRIRRRRAIEFGGKTSGPVIGDSLIIRMLIRIAAGRDMPDDRRRQHLDQVADRITSAIELAADERAEILSELRRRRTAGRRSA
jgi:hypothetical protein